MIRDESTFPVRQAVASNGDVDGAHELIQRLLEDPETKSQAKTIHGISGSFGKASCAELDEGRLVPSVRKAFHDGERLRFRRSTP